MATALYRSFNDDGDLLYVGISMRAAQRMHEHKKFSGWFEETTNIKVEWFDSRQDALEAEREAIKSEHPKYNVHHNKKSSEHDIRRDDFDKDEIAADVCEPTKFKRVQLHPVYTIGETASLLKVGATTVRTLIDKGELGAMEWGRQIRRVKGSDRKQEIITYRISGWQILDFLDSKGGR